MHGEERRSSECRQAGVSVGDRIAQDSPNPRVQQDDDQRMQAHIREVIPQGLVAPQPPIERIRGVHERAERRVDQNEAEIGEILQRPVAENRIVIVVDERIVERVQISRAGQRGRQ